MSFLSWLKPAPLQEEIKDKDLVDKKYKYWRIRTFYAMYIGYAFYYFSRKSFTFVMPSLIDIGFSKVELGILGSILSVTYGVSKFISGILGDRSNPRAFMATGLILTGIFNIFFGASSSLFFFAFFWGLNGWFQGWGWPGCAKLLTHWYAKKERGTWWSLWNTSHNLGATAIPILIAYCAQHFGWRVAMYTPGILCIIAGLFVFNRLRDTPRSLGLPSIEKYRGEEKINDKEEAHPPSWKELLFKYVLKNRYIWVLAITYFFVYIVRTGINDWSLLYLMEKKNYSHLVAGGCVSFFEFGGLAGSLVAGWASDKIFKGKRIPINILYSLGIVFCLIWMWAAGGYAPIVDSIIIFTLGFFIFGPQMLIGVAAAELSHKNAAATATGFAGCFAYLGAAVAGGPLGAVTDIWGWSGFFLILGFCGVVSTLLLLPLWSVGQKPKELPATS